MNSKAFNKLLFLSLTIILLIVAFATIGISILITAVCLFMFFVIVCAAFEASDLDDLLRQKLKRFIK